MKKLAVLLPTYNSGIYLRQSIDSLLNQTYSSFHIYVYDDCSTDNTFDIVNDYNDKRIFYRYNSKNLGIAKTLNLGLDELLTKYSYIARMDADDYCFSERFEKQLKKFEQDNDLVMCGTQGLWLNNFDETPETKWEYPNNHNEIRLNLLIAASFGHSSVMFDSQFMLKTNLRYDSTYQTCEDWELWTRLVKIGKVENLPDFLMKYRMVPTSNHRSKNNLEIHYKERSAIISNYWLEYDQVISPAAIYNFYYNREKIATVTAKKVLKHFIKIFNDFDTEFVKPLGHEMNTRIRYRFARMILSFWMNSGHSKLNLRFWAIILLNINFVGKIKLIRSLIK